MGTSVADAIEAYVSEKRSLRAFNERTATCVRSILRPLGERIATVDELTVFAVKAWLADWEGKASSQSNRVENTKRFLEWCVDAELILRNPIRNLDPPRVIQGEARYLEVDEARRLVAAARSPRDRAMILLMLHLGLRRKEVHELLLTDIDFDLQVLAIRGKGFDGEVSRRLPVPDEAWQPLKEWLAVRPNVGYANVFVTRNSRPIHTAVISRTVSDLMRRAGVKEHSGDGRSTHALRHTFAQHLIDDGRPIRKVQAAMGHATQQTTERYLRRRPQIDPDDIGGRSYDV